jgi:hypothetical protein
MDAQVLTDGSVADTRRLQQRRRAEGACGQDDLPGTDDELPDPRLRVGTRDQGAALDAYGATSFHEHLRDADLGHDPGTRLGRSCQVDADA